MLKLKLLNEGISCPHCHSYTDEVHQNRPILVRDLPISGRKIYLQVPLVGHADPATTAKYNLRGEAVK